MEGTQLMELEKTKMSLKILIPESEFLPRLRTNPLQRIFDSEVRIANNSNNSTGPSGSE